MTLAVISGWERNERVMHCDVNGCKKGRENNVFKFEGKSVGKTFPSES